MLEMAGRMGVLGTETAFEVLARANALAAQGRWIINLGIGQPDFPTPPHIVEAGRKALADGHHGYTPANGIPPLRAAVAADLWRRHKVEVSPDQVLVVPGGKVTMFFAIMMFGEPGVEILYPNPGFPIYESVIKFSGATVRHQGLCETGRGAVSCGPSGAVVSATRGAGARATFSPAELSAFGRAASRRWPAPPVPSILTARGGPSPSSHCTSNRRSGS